MPTEFPGFADEGFGPVADAFVDNFNDPAAQWEAVKSPDHAGAFLARHGTEMPVLG